MPKHCCVLVGICLQSVNSLLFTQIWNMKCAGGCGFFTSCVQCVGVTEIVVFSETAPVIQSLKSLWVMLRVGSHTLKICIHGVISCFNWKLLTVLISALC